MGGWINEEEISGWEKKERIGRQKEKLPGSIGGWVGGWVGEWKEEG